MRKQPIVIPLPPEQNRVTIRCIRPGPPRYCQVALFQLVQVEEPPHLWSAFPVYRPRIEVQRVV